MAGWTLATAVVSGLLFGVALGLIVGRRQAGAALGRTLRSTATGARPTLEGSLLGVRALLSEVGEARLREEQSHQRLLRALGGIPHGVVLFDSAGQVSFANASGGRFVRARHGYALVEGATRELVQALAADGETTVRQVDLQGPPREVFEIVACPLTDEQGGTLVLIENVTERRRLEEVRRDFVTNISHELKTPIGAMSLLTETLASEDDPAVVERLAGRVHDEAMRMSRSIDDLLLLSRIEGDEEPVREPVALSVVVAEAIDRLAAAAAERGIEIKVGDMSDDQRVWADRRQLVSAVFNLLDNAVKYSDDGALVEVRTICDGAFVTLEVEDRGIGIPARDIERVFERFYRVDRARSRRTGGTGLGLAIVRHVARNHNGEVAVRSREGEGSTFSIRLPIGQIAVQAPGGDEA